MKDFLTDIYNKVLTFFQSEKEESENTKDTAKNRLKLVLLQDRSNLEPETMARLRSEIVEVISKYIEIDKEALGLNLAGEGESIALMLNIPVIRAKTPDEIEKALKEAEEKTPNSAETQEDEEFAEEKEAEETQADIDDEEAGEEIQETSDDEAKETPETEEETLDEEEVEDKLYDEDVIDDEECEKFQITEPSKENPFVEGTSKKKRKK